MTQSYSPDILSPKMGQSYDEYFARAGELKMGCIKLAEFKKLQQELEVFDSRIYEIENPEPRGPLKKLVVFEKE